MRDSEPTMSEAETKYDVAISFLHADETLAREIDARLSEQFDVFVNSKRQEAIAGTNGLESFREAFLAQSRLVVVLYREGWGSTPFMRVEHQAVTERPLVRRLAALRDSGKGFPAYGHRKSCD